MAILARLSRTVPLLIALAILAAIIYLVVTYRESPNRAKEVLIKVFTVLTGVLSAGFALLTLYAMVENNVPVAELWGTFLAVTLIGLAITRFCRYRFIKNHPNYRFMPTKARVIHNRPWPFNNVKFPWEK